MSLESGVSTKLIVTVDTEEEGLWRGCFRPVGNTVENVGGTPRFQKLCNRFGIHPTYLVDAPVVQDESAVQLLRGFREAGLAEIGAHVHPWCNPPLRSPTGAGSSYLCNLPEDWQREKITWLTNAIDEQFGQRPTSFRAGRYGLDLVGARILEELGYLVDSSVIPFHDYSAEHGPDFEHAPYVPYWIGDTDLCVPTSSGRLLEIPVSVGFNRVNFRRCAATRKLAMRPPLRRLRSVGILDRLGIVKLIKFSPEQANCADLKRLVDVYLQNQSPCIVMMFHSSSLMPGFSPYVPDAESLERFYQCLAVVLEYCVERRGLLSAKLSEFAREYATSRPRDSVAQVFSAT